MAIKPIRVSQVNSFIKRVLQTDPLLGNISVIGEIANLKHHSSGHVYFTLKDENSKLSCFLAREQALSLHYQLEEGMEITAAGYIYVYERGGTYSLNVRDINVEGKGNLAVAYEKLRAKLEAEGLFDERYKKAIPLFPKQIVVITSDTGAAVQDIIKIISAKNDQIRVIVYPCLVQGNEAAADISKAIMEVNRLFPETDCLIVGRGGGSMEELWAFNEEVVARSIFLSEIPVISAVGHESDVTIADYVADKRAATPTDAADIAASDKEALQSLAKETARSLRRSIDDILQKAEEKTRRYDMNAMKTQILDRLRWKSLIIENHLLEIEQEVKRILALAETKTEKAKIELTAANPLEIMKKGYGLILDQEGRISSSALRFTQGDSLTVIFKDGKINCHVDRVRGSENEAEK